LIVFAAASQFNEKTGSHFFALCTFLLRHRFFAKNRFPLFRAML